MPRVKRPEASRLKPEDDSVFLSYDQLEGRAKLHLIRSLWREDVRGPFWSSYDRDGVPTPRKIRRNFESRWRSKKPGQFEAVVIVSADSIVQYFLKRFGPISEGLYVTLFPAVTFDRDDVRRRSRFRDTLRKLVTGLPPSVADEYEREERPIQRLAETLALAVIAAAHGEKLELQTGIPALQQWVTEASEAIVELAPRKEILLEVVRRDRYVKFVQSNIAPGIPLSEFSELLNRPLSERLEFTDFIAVAQAL